MGMSEKATDTVVSVGAKIGSDYRAKLISYVSQFKGAQEIDAALRQIDDLLTNPYSYYRYNPTYSIDGSAKKALSLDSGADAQHSIKLIKAFLDSHINAAQFRGVGALQTPQPSAPKTSELKDGRRSITDNPDDGMRFMSFEPLGETAQDAPRTRPTRKKRTPLSEMPLLSDLSADRQAFIKNNIAEIERLYAENGEKTKNDAWDFFLKFSNHLTTPNEVSIMMELIANQPIFHNNYSRVYANKNAQNKRIEKAQADGVVLPNVYAPIAQELLNALPNAQRNIIGEKFDEIVKASETKQHAVAWTKAKKLINTAALISSEAFEVVCQLLNECKPFTNQNGSVFNSMRGRIRTKIKAEQAQTVQALAYAESDRRASVDRLRELQEFQGIDPNFGSLWPMRQSVYRHPQPADNDPAGIRDLFSPYRAPRTNLKPLLDGTQPSRTPIKHVYYAPAWEGVLPPNQKPIFGSTGLSLGVMEIFATPTYNTIDTQGAKLSTPVVATMETLSDHINGAEDLSRAGHTTIHHSGISVNPKDVNAASPAKDANGLLIENITFGLLNALLSTGKIDSILTKLPSNLQGHARNVIEDLEARTKFDTKIVSNNIDVAAYMQELEAAGLGTVIDTGFAKKYISNTHTGSVGNAQTHSQNFIELFKSDPLVREELIHNLTESVRFTAQAEYNRQHNLPISREKLKIHVSPHTMRKLLETSIKGLRELALAYPKAPSIKALADLYQTILGDETSQVAPARILTAAEQLTIDTHLKSKVGNRTSRYWNKYNGILAHWCAKKNVSLMHFVGDPIKPEANPTFGFHSVNGATKYMKENGETVDASDFDVYMNGLVAPLPTSPEPKPKKTRNSTGVTAGSGKTKKTQKALENKEGKQDLVKTNDAIVPKAAKQDKVASPEHKQPILLSQEHSEIRGWRYNQEILVARTESEKTKLTDEYTREIYSRINKLSSDTFIYRHFNIEGRGVIETQSTGRINKNNVYYASAQEAKYNDFRRIELSLNRSGESFLSPTLIVAQHNLDEAKALLHMALSTYNIQSSDFTKLNRKISRQYSATATVLRNNMKAAFANPVQFMSKHSNDMTIDETNDQKITIENNRIADFNQRTNLINQQTATYREARLTAKTEFIALGGKVLDKNGLGTQRAGEGLARDKQDSSIPLYTGKELDEAKAIVAEARRINYAASARLGKQRAFFYDDIKKISQLDESKAKQLRAGIESQIENISNGTLSIQNAP
jgi:hypothetical protein